MVKRILVWLAVMGLSLALAAGCAHKPGGEPASGPADPAGPEMKAAPSEGTDQVADLSAEADQEAEPAAVDNPAPDEDDPFADDPFADDPFADEGEVPEESAQIADPLEGWNRAMFALNDFFYFYLLKPAAQGYQAVTPRGLRLGLKNFFHNLGMPLRFVSSFLQGKMDGAGRELAGFAINTTAGAFGFGNPAEEVWDIKPSEEDVGQTLGAWGMGHGFYIVWPILGPSTGRDTLGLAGDYFLDPVTYVDPDELSYGLTGLRTVNDTTFRLGDYESLKDAALDPYEAMKDFYLQYRNQKTAE